MEDEHLGVRQDEESLEVFVEFQKRVETLNDAISTRWRTRLSDRRRRRSISGNLELGLDRLWSASLGEREKERVSRKRSRDMGIMRMGLLCGLPVEHPPVKEGERREGEI